VVHMLRAALDAVARGERPATGIDRQSGY
jgi:hypothetical protein